MYVRFLEDYEQQTAPGVITEIRIGDKAKLPAWEAHFLNQQGITRPLVGDDLKEFKQFLEMLENG